MSGDVISSNKIYMLPDANYFHFGILCSYMHNSWTQHVSGRLESRIQYSNGIVYNNFPWPEDISQKQIASIENAAKVVLEVRNFFSDSSLAELYDPNSMPPELVKAHLSLDKAVDLSYRSQPFLSESKRIEFLFDLYDKYTSGLFVKTKPAKKAKSKKE